MRQDRRHVERRSAYERARAAWPSVDVPPEDFLSYLEERSPGATGTTPVPERQAEELYLACACARGDTEAIRIFIEQYLGKVRDLLGRRGRARAVIDEIDQQMREHLLVASPGKPARIGQYRGQGTLFGWLWASTIRLEGRMAKQRLPAPSSSPFPVSLHPVSPDDPEGVEIRRRYRRDIETTLREAIQSLSAEDRTLFRMNVVEGLSTVELAKIHGKSQPTISRWLARIREQVRLRSMELLKERLRLETRDLESMMNMSDAHLDMSVSKLFKKG